MQIVHEQTHQISSGVPPPPVVIPAGLGLLALLAFGLLVTVKKKRA